MMILNKQTKYFILVITLLLITCSDKTSFSSKSPAASEKGEDNSSPVTDGGDGDDIIIDNPEGGDILTQISQFKAVKDTTVVDYLFIIDNSCSAGTLRDSSQKAMADTVKIEGLLPGSPLIATMTTSHGDKNDLSKRGPEMRGHDYIELEPGFLDFYTKSQRDQFVRAAPANVGNNRYPLSGCEDKWFKPDQKDENGKLCIEAAFQSANSCTATEAGLLAFTQMIERNKGKQVFREGSSVNVIFISDTHDPGVDPNGRGKDIARQHKSYSEIKELVMASNNISGLKFHAIAPASESSKCASESFNGGSYLQLIKDSEGSIEDCNKNIDYERFMKNMILESKKIDSHSVKIDRRVLSVEKVEVDGQETKDYTFHKESNTVVVSSLKEDSRIEVFYIPSHKDD